ncbi:hypothetical protein NEIELOOT_01120 [Neisseria elongata subsp. glycolytica ATCC 29315]|uniref:Uncharacterized protein n=1 Tax=Neisseria elongata subsp. glycolytica ATCC 29315 TaxID=546263 RepID=D4DPY4_NEIEG|nr:hypothetical protein NEIELOOT_01120 [Neisseria elongata subsp. glycolytica ATCC 29315]
MYYACKHKVFSFLGGLYGGLNLNRYGVASPCPDLNLIHYTI